MEEPAMPSHGTPSLGHLAPFVGTATKALVLISDELEPDAQARWADKSEEMQALFRKVFLPQPLPVSPEQIATGIVKVVRIEIGGSRTTDQMIETAHRDCGKGNVNSDITQKNMPAGFGPLRQVTLEFRQFDHDPFTDEVTAWQNEPGCGPSGYEDGLRFREKYPEDQRQQPHIFVPENPWCDADGIPCALSLWSRAVDRMVDLYDGEPRVQWLRNCLFARRKYLAG